MIKKLINKLFNKNSSTKTGGHDLDDKSKAKESKPIDWTTATTSANAVAKNIKITPAHPEDKVIKVNPSTSAKKPGRPKSQTPKPHSATKSVKKATPSNNTNKK
jgi:hypothetical protein